jgi:universal stress protein A
MMLEIKLILCPIDFSEWSVRAYYHALSVAGHYQAKVAALHVVDLSRHISLGFAATAGLYNESIRAFYDDAEEQLKTFVKHHTNSEIQPELSVEMGNAPDTILSFAQARNADAIVMGTHGQRAPDAGIGDRPGNAHFSTACARCMQAAPRIDRRS